MADGNVLELTAANAGAYGNISLDGGTVRFAADGYLKFPGLVSGNGVVEKVGDGVAVLSNVTNMGAGCAIDVKAGKLEIGALAGDVRIADGAGLNVGHRSVFARKLRLQISRTTANNVHTQFQLKEIDLYLNGERIPWPQGTIVTSSKAGIDGGSPATLIDRDGDGLGGRYYAEYNNNPIVFEFDGCLEFDGYSLWSGGDCISGVSWDNNVLYFSRHPIDWQLDYSPDGTTWVTFDKQTDNRKIVGKDGTEITLTLGQKMLDTNFSSAETFKTAKPIDAVGARNWSEAAITMCGPDSVLNINRAHASAASLSGSGVVAADARSFFAVHGDDSAFDGEIVGGVVAKVGGGVQSLCGSVKCAELAIEGGELNMAGAELSGAENGVTLRGSRSVVARQLRLTIQRTTGLDANRQFQLSEVDLYLNGARVPWPQGTTVSANASIDGLSAETLMDRNGDALGGRYLASYTGNPIVWTFPGDVELDGYSLWTSGDCINGVSWSDDVWSFARHPISWKMEYSSDGVEWTLLDKQTDLNKIIGKDGSEKTLYWGQKMLDANFFRAECYKFRMAPDGESGAGGVLTGTARTAGDLAVLAAGGSYGAEIAVGGTLMLGADDLFKLFVGDGRGDVRRTSFTFGECDEDSVACYMAAVTSAPLVGGQTFAKSVTETALAFKAAREGTIITIR